ncbi:MAG: GAF domain-containing protein [Acidobacteriota bacterium]
MSANNLISSKIEEVKAGLINDLDQLKGLYSPGGESGSNINDMHKYIKKISSSVNQINLISNLLKGINLFCSRTAIFLLRDDKLVGWGGSGIIEGEEETSNKEIKKMFFSLSADTSFKAVLESKKPFSGDPMSHPDNHLIYSRFGNKTPQSVFVVPFFVKGKPQAVIYSDSLDEKKISEKEIEIITTVGEMSMDLLPIKQKIIARVKTQEYEEEKESKGKTDTLLKVDVSPSKPIEIKESDPERMARVIVNDIILYNKKRVEDARAQKKVYQILKGTILQSKELYMNKHSDLRPFEIQLLETLADGDRESLEGYEFETI